MRRVGLSEQWERSIVSSMYINPELGSNMDCGGAKTQPTQGMCESDREFVCVC